MVGALRETAGLPAPATQCWDTRRLQKARPLYRPSRPRRVGKRVNGKASRNAREQPKEAGDGVQPANRQLRPSRGDQSADSCIGHLPKHPDNIIEENAAGPLTVGPEMPSARYRPKPRKASGTTAQPNRRTARPAISAPPADRSIHSRHAPVAGLSRAAVGPPAPPSSALVSHRQPYPDHTDLV